MQTATPMAITARMLTDGALRQLGVFPPERIEAFSRAKYPHHQKTTMVATSTRDYTMFIGGEWVVSTGKEMMEIVNLATYEEVHRVLRGTGEDVDGAMRAAREAFEDGRQSRLGCDE